MKFKISLAHSIFFLLCTHASLSHADFDGTLKLCADCHGKSGNSDKESMPTIAGISQVYFTSTIEAFKQGDRPATTVKRKDKADTNMQDIAKELDDAQVKKLAEYFSKQKFIMQPQIFDTDKARDGKRLHKQYCEKCHEKGGSSSADDAGILAGQQRIYLKKSLDEIIKGDRGVGKKMTGRIKKVQQKYGDEGFEQLIEYYISQDSKP